MYTRSYLLSVSFANRLARSPNLEAAFQKALSLGLLKDLIPQDFPPPFSPFQNLNLLERGAPWVGGEMPHGGAAMDASARGRHGRTGGAGRQSV